MLIGFILSFFATAVLVVAIHDRQKLHSPLEHQFPFLVALCNGYDTDTLTHVCGGAIISKNYVLTSADCFEDAFKPDRIITGSDDLNSGGTLHIITRKHIHEDYENGNKAANIAVVKVSPSFDFGPWIKPIPLEIKELPSIVAVGFAGWGSIGNSENGRLFPETLRYIDLVTITNKHCNDYGLNVTDKQICTLTRIGQGLCLRDQGGPLVEERKIKTVMGIATRRYSCGNGFPDVYTKVSPFISWINATCKCI